MQGGSLSISNLGTGDLSWTASSDQPWLTLGAAAGVVTEGGPASALSLQADPSGLADNSTAAAHVTIAHPASGKSATIPVSLSKGFVWEPEPVITPPTLPNRTFLPAVVR